MRNRWRELIEALLPWFNPALERRRDARTENIRQRSIAARIRTEKIIADYQAASAQMRAHGRRLIQETRRADEER